MRNACARNPYTARVTESQVTLSSKQPTGGFANPTLTALALSDELAVLTDLPGYLRPITTETGKLRCTGKVVSMGRTVAVSDAALLDESERPLARATATCLIINPPTKETLSTGRQVAHMRGKDRSSDGCG